MSVALLWFVVLPGCAPAAPADDSGTILPPEPLVGEVSAAASAEGASQVPGVSVAYDITSASSLTVVVTKLRPLEPVSYIPADLLTLRGVPGGDSQRMRAQAATAMARMSRDATAAGVPFRISTAYRSFGLQQYLHTREVRRLGTAEADRRVARPGHSEHQTGLAADIYDVPTNELSQSFGESAAGTWVRDNAYAYGFIVSYPDGVEAVTGYFYEPWHVRYVGEKVAGDMRNTGIETLQEYFDIEASPGYE